MAVIGFVVLGGSLAGVFPALIALTPVRLGEQRAHNVISWQVGSAAAGGAGLSAVLGLLIGTTSLAALGPAITVLALIVVAAELALNRLAPVQRSHSREPGDTESVDRERAETFLRLLAEAELRDPLPPPRHPGGATDFPRFSVPARCCGPPGRRAAWALTAVQALDVETADSVLTDIELALARRRGPAATACFMIAGSFGQIAHQTARDHETPRRPPRRGGWHRAAAAGSEAVG